MMQGRETESNFGCWRRVWLVIVCLVLSLGVFSSQAWAVGVAPLMFEMETAPGTEEEFTLLLTPGEVVERIRLSVYKPNQVLDGSLAFEPADPTTFPAAEWVEFESDEVEIKPGQVTSVTGKIKVPYVVRGSHTVILMVEQIPDQKKAGMNFMVRYAVRLHIRIPMPGLRAKAKIEEISMLPGPEKEPLAMVKIVNPSELDYLVSGEATLRDANNRLVERLQLQSPYSKRYNKESTRIYPGSTVVTMAPITSQLVPGEYNLRVFMRYGEHSQLIETRKIAIRADEFNLEEQMAAFTLDQSALEFALKPGQRKSFPIAIESKVAEDTYVVASFEDVQRKYPFSLVEWGQIVTQDGMKLRGYQKARIVGTLIVPRETESGSYHGRLVIRTFSKEKQLVGVETVPVTLWVGAEQDAQAELRSVSLRRLEHRHLISLDVKNSGQLAFAPKVEVKVSTKEAVIATTTLTLPEGIPYLLPAKSQQLEGLIPPLPLGTYTLEMRLYQGGKQINHWQETFQIEE